MALREGADQRAIQLELIQTIGRLEGVVEGLRRDISQLNRKVEEFDRRLDRVELMATRWKGGFAVLLAFGSIAAWAASLLGGWFKEP